MTAQDDGSGESGAGQGDLPKVDFSTRWPHFLTVSVLPVISSLMRRSTTLPALSRAWTTMLGSSCSETLRSRMPAVAVATRVSSRTPRKRYS